MAVPVLKVFKLKEEAQVPEKATSGSACFDVRCCLIDGETVVGYNRHNVKFEQMVHSGTIKIKGGDRLMIPTGLIFDIPKGYSVRFHPRSGASLKQGLIMANCEGVIDSDYVEESMILLLNNSDELIKIKHGERVCQAELFEDQGVEIVATLNRPGQKTERVSGFGHTGKE